MRRLHFLTVLLMVVVLIALVATALLGGGERAGAEVRPEWTMSNPSVGQATETSTPTDTATPNFIYTPTDTTTPGPIGSPTSTPFPTPPQPSATMGPSATPTPRTGCASNFEILEFVPSASSGRFNQLEAIDAISENDIWTVGQTTPNYPDGTPVPIIEHWDGAQWSIVSSPVITGSGTLYGVDALPSGEVWAVGYYDEGQSSQALIEQWDGTQWSIVPSPVITGATTTLNSVSALSPTDAWAVGTSTDGAYNTHTFIIHWDGTAWSVVAGPNPDPDGHRNALYGVKAIASDDVWAVGEYGFSFTSLSLALHWDGTQWTQVSTPSMTGYSNTLLGVDALTSGDVWAVGSYNYNNPYSLTMHWDGAAWTIVPSPNGWKQYTRIYSVSMVSHNEVWAAGTMFASTFVLYWNGTQWTEIGTSQRGGGSGFFGLKAVSTLDVWMVGAYWTLDNDLLTLTMKYTGIFTDLGPLDYYFTGVRYMYCLGAVSGYSDGTFRPYNSTTRGQVSKMVVLAENIPINTQGGPHFSDVPESNPFYQYIETAYNAQIISGYSDGTFRWGLDVTRSQFCKIIVIAAHYTIDTTGGPHFRDVPLDSPFYQYVETAYNHQIINGYSCGPGCLEFRPGNNATRGQIAAIIQRVVQFP